MYAQTGTITRAAKAANMGRELYAIGSRKSEDEPPDPPDSDRAIAATARRAAPRVERCGRSAWWPTADVIARWATDSLSLLAVQLTNREISSPS